MRIKIINPNTSADMTKSIGAMAKKHARPGTEIIAVSPERGPISIEDHYDDNRPTVNDCQDILNDLKRR